MYIAIKKFKFVLRKDFQKCLCTITRLDHKTIYGNVYHLYRLVNIRMHSIVISKLCHVITVLNRKQFFPKSRIIFFPILYYTTYYTKTSVFMASKSFKGQNDHYNGVTVDSNEESCESEEFTKRLTVSLKEWIKNKKRTIWFRVHLPHSEWVPILVKNGFKFHHAREEYVTLYQWLSTDEKCNVPHYAHTNLGVGAFVYNEKTDELLVIKEKYINKAPFWKLPGGFVEPGEDLEIAVKREVLEETGIETTLKCLIGFRHAHDYAFSCSDIYIIFYLSPINYNIKMCDREISECKWMKVMIFIVHQIQKYLFILPQMYCQLAKSFNHILSNGSESVYSLVVFNEYMEHSEVHQNNKLMAKKVFEFFKHKMGITVEYSVHPIFKKPISIYSISKIDNENV
ncbi:uncharacterized protein LOC143148063 isoform X3 [Ptiloglossa arizonensis]|uniref:uncharacterized protein LOC143148063 isoform X3 n=1 Tax=Ptiloglossa arizonensis TaxID=3350558 RepID=UPI003FA1707F